MLINNNSNGVPRPYVPGKKGEVLKSSLARLGAKTKLDKKPDAASQDLAEQDARVSSDIETVQNAAADASGDALAGFNSSLARLKVEKQNLASTVPRIESVGEAEEVTKSLGDEVLAQPQSVLRAQANVAPATAEMLLD